MSKVVLLLTLLTLSGICSFGQDIQLKGKFLKDSTKIGLPIGFSVSAEYPIEIDLVFPDSTGNYFPYEFHEKLWFPSIYENGIVKDSAVYYLTSFEVDSIQKFSLGIYRLSDGDSSVLMVPEDSFALIHTVRSSPDSLGAIFLQEDTQYYRVPKPINYPFVIAGLFSVILIVVVIWLLFGKKIIKYLKIRRMKRANEKFREIYDSLLAQLNEDRLPTMSESLLIHWKEYMEELESVPYRKLTTKELSQLDPDERMIRTLRTIDKAIYSSAELHEVKSNLSILEELCQERYEQKLEEVAHGRFN